MSRPERKASRILLKYGVVGDYDGAYDWVDSGEHNNPEYSIGEHKGAWPSDGYMVIEVVDTDYIDNLEMWFDAELKAAENDYKRYKQLKATNAALLEALNEVHEWFTEGGLFEWPNQQEAEKAYALSKVVKEAIRKATA